MLLDEPGVNYRIINTYYVCVSDRRVRGGSANGGYIVVKCLRRASVLRDRCFHLKAADETVSLLSGGGAGAGAVLAGF